KLCLGKLSRGDLRYIEINFGCAHACSENAEIILIEQCMLIDMNQRREPNRAPGHERVAIVPVAAEAVRQDVLVSSYANKRPKEQTVVPTVYDVFAQACLERLVLRGTVEALRY